MDIKLVASDLDGTIIDKNNNISEKNFQAIELLHKKNIPFTICTGKSYAVSKKVCEKFNADFGVFGNGTQIIDFHTNKELYKKVLSKDDLIFICTFAKRHKYHIHLYTENDIISEKLEYMDLRNYKLKEQNSNNSLNFIIVENVFEYIKQNNLDVFSLVISSQNHILQKFKYLLSINPNIMCTYINKRGKYKDLIIDKNYEYLNISPNNINKNEALTFLKNYLKIEKENIMAVGDNINDFEMIKHSGFGVAVNDAYDDLKNVANYVTKNSVTDGAFAEAIQKYIK